MKKTSSKYKTTFKKLITATKVFPFSFTFGVVILTEPLLCFLTNQNRHQLLNHYTRLKIPS